MPLSIFNELISKFAIVMIIFSSIFFIFSSLFNIIMMPKRLGQIKEIFYPDEQKIAA
jgi:hypothetical protein